MNRHEMIWSCNILWILYSNLFYSCQPQRQIQFFCFVFFSSKNSSRLACNYLFYYMGALFGLPYQLSKGKRYRNYLKERPNCHFHGLSFHFLFVVLLNCLFFNGNFFYGYFYGNTFPVSCQYAHIWVKDKNYLTATATVKQVSEYSDPSSLMQ